ncbi:LOW QUALITY PROTEIN: kinesin-like protein KIN-7F [Phalaenopsis equestris]|uniref:LOW QUALITY PROTEIN: kinesin-like protein KIN-7F n=1 Tax=Phalaenopsis equestris TaxID=78828 RepID=UPI0009E1C7AE|nr:LOW QUALITY PROTEIN: kinesin-like protein KIN-7F [Phalaenopsis equestris]
MGAISGEEMQQFEAVVPIDEMDGGGGGGGGGHLERILVSVRLRPLSEKEILANDPAEWECINDSTIIFRSGFQDRHLTPIAHTFDRVFGSESTTKQVYEEAAKEVALSAVSGINSSIFAYGQTSSGKTYTMTGITEYTVADIYDYIKRHPERAFSLKLSAIEIYNEAVRDLLSLDGTPLRLLDDPERGTIVEKLKEETLHDPSHLKALLALCEAQRRIGETSLNEMSSRSHQILRLTIESSAREFLGKDNTATLSASVNFVDLAGSERASQALSVGTRLKEGCHINRSLLTLGTVIRKLSKGRNSHIPYRESKLTRILTMFRRQCENCHYLHNLSRTESYEQSRNTLLFANCAKEVATNAQVNVVMSDKALVKHLQKELARLENELRCPALAPNNTHFEALLREKDARIRKLEKEIKELIQQRDLAQSRLEDLLHAVGDDHSSRQLLESPNQSSISHPFNVYDDESSKSEPPEAAHNGSKSGFAKIRKFESKNQSRNHHGFSEDSKNGDFPPKLSQSKHRSHRWNPTHAEEDADQDASENSEELCKEVRCIEMDGTGQRENSNFSLPEASETRPVQTSNVARNGEHEPNPTGSPFLTLEHHLHSVRASHPDESFLRSSSRELHGSGAMLPRRSRSCRATFSTSYSPGFAEADQSDYTPPTSSLRDFPGRPRALQGRLEMLNHDAENGSFSRDDASRVLLKEQDDARSSKEDITTIQDFVSGLKEMVQVHQNQLVDGQAGSEVSGTMKSVGLDTIPDPMDSPSHWPQDFEKKQQEIIKLWNECNVSLIHRTYFFLLFKGDPADSIYMEVELRRLSFLKRTFSLRNSGRIPGDNGRYVTLESSMRTVQRERDMLCRQMLKRLATEERLSLYVKWGISLNSKQRKVQLARLLWTNTGDLEHVRESALTVAKLIGLLESGHVLKEMFGLSFSPQNSYRRSHRWRHGIYTLK